MSIIFLVGDAVAEPMQSDHDQAIMSIHQSLATEQTVVAITEHTDNIIHHSQPTRSKNISWVWVYDKLSTAIKVRHYSPKTLKSYQGWVRKIQAFTQSKKKVIDTHQIFKTPHQFAKFPSEAQLSE